MARQKIVYTDGSDIQRGNQLQIGNYFGNSASKKRGDSNVCCTKESFWTLFMLNHAHEKAQGREIGVGHEQVLQKRERSFYIVDLWTATGIRIQPNQQIVAKSLAAYWNR